MARNFVDSWQNIFDQNGKFLVGRLTFLEPNTSGNKLTIYDVDGNELDNPIYTSQFGLPAHQVILSDRDYKVTYEMYIGNGNMESDENESNWLLYKTETSLNGELTVEQNTNIPTFCDTIAQLKDLSLMNDGDTAIIKGYYTACDSGAMRVYVWHAAGNYTDDGGITITSNNTTTGAWIMTIPGDYIDVRWYGDLPDTSYNPSSQQSNIGQRSRAASAANTYDKNLYFPAIQRNTTSTSFYIFDGSNTISVDQDIICDSSVRFVVKSGTTGTVVSCKQLVKPSKFLFISSNPSAQIGGYKLISDWINTSWLNTNTLVAEEARVGYVIDLLNSSLTFNNTKIKVERDGINLACTFDNCEMVECYKQITRSCIMYNMVIKTDWFADDYSWSNLSLSDCVVKLENCKDADTYIILKNKLNEADYGDLKEATLDNANILADAILENFNGSITIHGSIEIHNASVTINGISSSYTINAIDSWITIPSFVACDTLEIRRGLIQGDVVTVISKCYMNDVDINSGLGVIGADATFNNCRINAKITTTDVTITNCLIKAIVETINVSTNLRFLLSNNIFIDNNSYHYVHSVISNCYVSGKWIDNHAAYVLSDPDKYFIRIDRSNLLANDRDHDYVYEGNDALPQTNQTFTVEKNPTAGSMPAGNYLVWRSGAFDPYLAFRNETTTVDTFNYTSYGMQVNIFHVGVNVGNYKDNTLIRSWDGGSYVNPSYPALIYRNPWIRFMNQLHPVTRVTTYDPESQYVAVVDYAWTTGVDPMTSYKHQYIGTLISDCPETVEQGNYSIENATFKVYGFVKNEV